MCFPLLLISTPFPLPPQSRHSLSRSLAPDDLDLLPSPPDSPFLLSLYRPDTRYADTSAGAIAQAATARDLKMFTRGDGRVFLHPSSINFRQGDFTSPWLVYHTKRVGVQASMLVLFLCIYVDRERGERSHGPRVGWRERGRERERGNTYICSGGREDAANDTRFRSLE